MAAQGIDKPRDDGFSQETLDEMATARRKSKAALAELEILHRDRLAKLADPAAVRQEEDDYHHERRRIEERCERAIEKLRQGE